MMAAIALIALAMAIVDQYARRQQALVRQEQLRAEAAFKRAQAALASFGAGAAQQRRTVPAALKP
jgi:hypothetical protein